MGPNGAGKTTLVSLLATERIPTSGSVVIGGRDTHSRSERLACRAFIGYLPQQFEIMPNAKVIDNVAYSAWAHGVPESECDNAASEALQLVDLSDRARERARRLSGGMRQRLGIACAIAHRPRLLLLDEPTVGLDPVQRVQIRAHLEEIAKSATVIISTHLIEDLRMMASKVLILSDGNIVFAGTIEQLQQGGSSDPGGHASDLELAYQSLVR